MDVSGSDDTWIANDGFMVFPISVSSIVLSGSYTGNITMDQPLLFCGINPECHIIHLSVKCTDNIEIETYTREIGNKFDYLEVNDNLLLFRYLDGIRIIHNLNDGSTRDNFIKTTRCQWDISLPVIPRLTIHFTKTINKNSSDLLL